MPKAQMPSTNTEITKALIGKSEKVAKMMAPYTNVDESGNIIDFDFEKFATTTTIVEKNEFANEMFNKIMTQRTFSPLGGWTNPLARLFTREKNVLGSSEEWLSVDIVEAQDYDPTGASLLTPKYPTFNIQEVYDTDCKVYVISLAPGILNRAFVTEYALADIMAEVTSQLRRGKDVYMYDLINAKLATITKLEKFTEKITDYNDTENARKIYEHIIKLVTDLSIPNKLYNANEKLCTTNMGEAILILNSAYNASFDVNVIASLFNSGTIGEKKYFKEVVVVKQPEDANCFGYILDPDAIIVTNDKLETTAFYNPSNMVTTYYLHNWTKTNINKAVNALKLVYEAQA